MKKTKEQNKRLKLFKKLVITVGYVWTLTFLCSALFREEIRNLHLYLLPMGYKPKDIKTFYFDEDLAQWKVQNTQKVSFMRLL